jgi:hypothetical protein
MKYSNEEERRAAKARQKLESQRRNGHANQTKYEKSVNWKHSRERHKRTGHAASKKSHRESGWAAKRKWRAKKSLERRERAAIMAHERETGERPPVQPTPAVVGGAAAAGVNDASSSPSTESLDTDPDT